jgi:hypothetical protein
MTRGKESTLFAPQFATQLLSARGYIALGDVCMFDF